MKAATLPTNQFSVMEKVDVSDIITRLLEKRNSPGAKVNLKVNEVKYAFECVYHSHFRYLIETAREIFISQPVLLYGNVNLSHKQGLGSSTEDCGRHPWSVL